jgi:hypothetical protein
MILSMACAGFESQCGTGLPSGPGSSSLMITRCYLPSDRFAKL